MGAFPEMYAKTTISPFSVPRLRTSPDVTIKLHPYLHVDKVGRSRYKTAIEILRVQGHMALA